MGTSIRARLTLSHLLVIVLAMGISGLLLLSLLERYFVEAAEESLMAQARITAQAVMPGAQIAGPDVASQNATSNTIQQQQIDNLYVQTQNVAVPPDTLNLNYLSNASLQLGAQINTRIRILDPQGVVLVDSAQQEPGADLHRAALVEEALNGDYATRRDDQRLEVALPAFEGEKMIGVVYLSQPLNDVTAVLGDLREQWLQSTLIALALSALAGLLLSRAITRPIRRLTAATAAVAQGQFDLEVPARSKDEIGRLSRAFNEMIARLRSARQMQVDFVANVSHELRTPLTSIKGMVETLRDGAVDDPQVRDTFLETLEHETNRLIRLVNDLLILSRADSAALNLRRERVRLPDLVRLTAARLNDQDRVHIEANGHVAAWADSDRVAQVLVNLLDNALKYSPEDAPVTVAVEPVPDGAVRVRISDLGMGIAADELPRIGQRFYRADKARSRASGGSGLGLAIADALVRAHGGMLWVESQEGQGTTACFTLPAA